jgi:hypothetical protein
MEGLVDRLAAGNGDDLERLIRRVNLDMGIRGKATREFGLSVDLELFYFGSPLFQLVQLLGFVVSESVQGLQLHHDSLQHISS